MNQTKTTTPNLLVMQQITNALNDFYKMLSIAIDDMEKIEVLLLQNYVPCEIQKIEKDRSMFYARNGIVKCMCYYDPVISTFRMSGGLNFTYDFIFLDEQLETNRQILEIVHSMYISKYEHTESTEYVDNLVKKFMNLTIDSDMTDPITEIVVENFDRESEKIKID